MMRKPALLLIAIALLVAGLWTMQRLQQPATPRFAPELAQVPSTPPANATATGTPAGDVAPQALFLPDEARDAIRLIQRGGPFPHRQDGSVFGNREGHLPDRPHGYYREYTVATPAAGNRGARRIVTGGTPPREWYYSDDHYDSFRRFEVTP